MIAALAERMPHLKVPFRREEGQAAFEFVLVMPLLVLFFLLLVDFGILMYEYVSVSNAAREGARYAAANCGDGSCLTVDVRTRTAERSAGFLRLTPMPTCVVPTSSAEADMICVNWVVPGTATTRKNRGDAAVVTVNHMYDFLFFPFSVPVLACADMRLESNDTAAYDGSGPTRC